MSSLEFTFGRVEVDVNVLLLDRGIGVEWSVLLLGGGAAAAGVLPSIVQPGAKLFGEARAGPWVTAMQPGYSTESRWAGKYIFLMRSDVPSTGEGHLHLRLGQDPWQSTHCSRHL